MGAVPRVDKRLRALLTPASAVVALAVLVVFVVQARGWAFLCDDAYISFRYAANLAAFGELEFNPGERVEGYTNFGWVLLLGLGALLGVDPPTLAPVLTVMSAGAILILATLLGRRLARPDGPLFPLGAADLVTPALLVTVPEVMVWSRGGLETSFAVALALGSMLAWQRGRPVLGAALAAGTGLTRPDGLLAIGVFVLVDAMVSAVRRRELPHPPRVLVVAAAALIVPLGLHLAWRHAYYGAWLPNTWSIKAHGALLKDSWGTPYIAAWASSLHLLVAAPLLVLVRVRHLCVLLPVLAVVAYVRSVGGDFMAYSRFLLPATVLVGVLVGWLLRDLASLTSKSPLPRWGSSTFTVLGLALAVVLAVQTRGRWKADMAKPSGWLGGRFEGVAAMDRFARVRVGAGQWMREHLPPDTLISVGAAGALPYAAGVRVFDVYGLVDPAIADLGIEPVRGKRGRPGHQIMAPLSYVRRRDPDLACHVGHVGPRPPRRVQGPHGRGHDWACAPVPPLFDPRIDAQPFDAGQYCCRRRRDRIVGPFGAPEGSP